jgi:hypothetical protein
VPLEARNIEWMPRGGSVDEHAIGLYISNIRLVDNLRVSKIIKFLLALVVAVMAQAGSFASEVDFGLINAGRADDLKQALNKEFELASGDEKVLRLNQLLEVCILTDDQACVHIFWDKHYTILYDYADKLKKGPPEEQKKSGAFFDSITSKYLYRVITSEHEESLRERVRSLKKNGSGHAPLFEYAPMVQTLGAKVAGLVEDRQLARQLQRKARVTIFQRNLNQISTQAALAEMVETSLYVLHDVEDVKRLYQAFRAASLKDGKNIAEYINPYSWLRLMHVFYNAGILSREQEFIAIERLHNLYQSLQITQGSRLYSRKVEFYAYLALEEAFGQTRQLSFKPKEYLYQDDDQVFAAVGVRAYLEAAGLTPVGAKKGYSLSTLLNWFDSNSESAGPSMKRLYAPTVNILRSLDYRLKKSESMEIKSIEGFMYSQLDYFKKAGYRMLDTPPSLSRPALIVNRYAIERLSALAPDSKVLGDFALFNILSINAAKDTNRKISYALLADSNTELEREQVINFVTLNDRYNRATSEVYLAAALEMKSSRQIGNFSGVTAVEKFEPLEDLFDVNVKQISRLGSRPNYLPLATTGDLANLAKDGVGIAIAETSGFILVVTTSSSRNKPSVRLLNKPLRNDITAAIAVLQSKEIATFDHQAIRQASLAVSKYIFGERESFFGQTRFLTGPSPLGIPYTLLSDPDSERWLVEAAIPRAFASIEHAKLVGKKKISSTKIRYVAFANPTLRGLDDMISASFVDSLIRGGTSVTDLAELPETETEVKAFANAVLDKHNQLFFGADANIDNLFSINFDDVETVSFNTHGVIAGEVVGATSPSIVLSPTELNSGLVSSEWLFSVKGSPRVAVLSTCNSATVGQNFDQSEITSLSSAFLLKGADAVISSFWQVNSLGTTELMTNLAQRIAQGYEYGEALALTNRSMLQKKRWSHPSMWAAFVIVGEYSPALKSATSSIVSGVEKLSLNGFSNSSVISQGDAYFQLWDPKIKQDTIQRIKPVDLKFERPEVIVKSTQDEIFQISSASEAGLVYAQRDQSWVTFLKLDIQDQPEKLCKFKAPLAWRLVDFFVDRSVIFSVFTRASETEGLRLSVVTQDLVTCSENIWSGSYQSEYYKSNQISVHLYPGPKENSGLLAVNLPKLDEDGKTPTYVGGKNRFGFDRTCTVSNGSEIYLFSRDAALDEEHIWGDLKFLDSPEARTRGLLVIVEGSCGGVDQARIAKVDWLVGSEPMWFSDEQHNLPKSEESVAIAAQFSVVQQWWTSVDGDLVYVLGTPGFQGSMFKHFKSGQLTKATNDFLIRSEYAVYVASKQDFKWRKLIATDKCHLPRPLTHRGTPKMICRLPDENGIQRTEDVILTF